jgi:hypothetical protein
MYTFPCVHTLPYKAVTNPSHQGQTLAHPPGSVPTSLGRTRSYHINQTYTKTTNRRSKNTAPQTKDGAFGQTTRVFAVWTRGTWYAEGEVSGLCTASPAPKTPSDETDKPLVYEAINTACSLPKGGEGDLMNMRRSPRIRPRTAAQTVRELPPWPDATHNRLTGRSPPQVPYASLGHHIPHPSRPP